ncbi:phosphatidylinositol 4-kinase-like protein PIK1 [Aaosphaeria arxii CBS 175.79]|uniref:1-phosphatidylinositol 4-kinase n=1 Tax=Aaosphaeria arxii CBS 175.79 TaxID=1450172 RepID=A0A6A5XQD7_9PLEO|nr:phosphatidylinositol 4-kinase-like protein PIK1 [Aaosphaeria arxii CBS 175.79]KAF2015505.1 phosphatidylinositol 4-kinase-like protein PIK1 [Aaosphaeria arxii CBS 175.79]
MSWNLLERFIESDHFNTDPSLTVAYLSRYADHVGIHYVLCSKLRQFAYEEIEFFLPQLCHLLISVDNESMALEEFIIDLCEESVNGALLTFWLFQTYLHDLASDPNSNAFKTCRRIYNKVQRIVFGSAEPQRREKIKENILPVTVLSSLVLASIAAPFLPRHAGPLAIAQARKPRPAEDMISDNVQTAKVGRSHTVAGRSPRPKQSKFTQGHSDPEDQGSKLRPTRDIQSSKDLRRKAARPIITNRTPSGPVPRSSLLSATSEARLSSSSLPDFPRSPKLSPLPTPPLTAGLGPTPDHHGSRKPPHISRPLTPTALSTRQKIRLLRSNYFKNETQFLSALEDISNRLVIVPKPARLSALRAELALIAQDLPAEVDIPVISPATLKDGVASHSQHHRIVRINPAESTSLNSAERVPYLLMVEVLKEDFDFDPETEQNQQLLEQLMLDKGTSKRRLFDITHADHFSHDKTPPNGTDSVFEPANGDLGSTSLISDLAEDDISSGLSRVTLPSTVVNGKNTAPRSSSGANTMSSIATSSTPRTSDMEISRSNSPAPRKMTLPLSRGSQGMDQPDFSALATHMRTAAQMLAQLEASGSKRPKTEVAAIKAKIIASMQTLEEQNFMSEDATPTFDTIMAETDPVAITAEPDVLEEGIAVPTTNPGAGAARMENDLKTGGMQRNGDRDDPSAATFGEEWSAKRERIRRSSPYGHMKNWDLISVIVKTGADLRQEAFACQLIQVCTKIWKDANVPIWTKRMRILVTGESCGLIETITNGVSLHSLKRSLTLASIAAGTNPRKRIATLKDHFVKTFGEPDSESYKSGVDAFTRSLAAYSIICYVLQLKDRHNGNLLIDNMGHIIHIDFGFMLSNSPGSMGFEAAPFKLTQDYVDVLGGLNSPAYEDFKKLCKESFQALRKEAERLIMLVDMMGKQSKMPCFAAGAAGVTNSLRARMMLHLSKEEAEVFVDELIAKSVGSYYTRLYDTFQYRTQGIY